MMDLKKKEFTYRGKTIDELKKMDTREFAKFLCSRQRRSVLRHFDLIERFIKKCVKNSENGKQIKTHHRSMVVVPKMVGYTIMIHDGSTFVKIPIIKEMVGYRLGEFAPSRKKVKHGAAGIGATKSSASRSVK